MIALRSTHVTCKHTDFIYDCPIHFVILPNCQDYWITTHFLRKHIPMGHVSYLLPIFWCVSSYFPNFPRFLIFLSSFLNTQNMTNLTSVSTVKMEYGWNFSISGLKVMVKWSRKNIFEIPPCAHYVIFITEFVLLTKTPPFFEVNWLNRKWWAHGGISKIFFLDHFSPSFLGQKC